MLMTAVGLGGYGSGSYSSPSYDEYLFAAALHHDLGAVSRRCSFHGVENANESGETVLHMAVKRPCEKPNEEQRVIKILDLFVKRKIIKVNSKCNAGRTSLHLAAKNRMYKVADYLIAHGANLNVKDKRENGIAHCMVEGEFQRYFELTRKFSSPAELQPYFKESVGFFKKMLSKNIPIDYVNSNQDTPLQIAVRRNLLHILPILLEYTRNVELRDKAEQNVLHLMIDNKYSGTYVAIPNSCYNKNLVIDIFEMMMSKGFSVTDMDVHGNTPIHYAVNKDMPQFIKSMLYKLGNIDVCDRDGNSILHFIIDNCIDSKSKQHKKEYAEFVHILLSNGADIDKQNNDRYKPLHLAVMRVHPTILLLLKDHGTDLQESYNGGNLLHLFSENSSEIISSSKFEEVIVLLVSQGCDVNSRNEDGMTPMHVAVQSGRNDMIKMLIKFHANVDARDFSDSGLTPLQMAVKCGKDYLLETLIKFGADVNAKDSSGKTALHLAMEFKNNMVKTLLSSGAHIDVEDDEELLPLHYAIKNQNGVAVTELLKYGADINDIDTYHELLCLKNPDFMLFGVVEHWIKMKAAGLPIASVYSKHTSNDTYQKLYQDCLKEIEDLKAYKIGNRTSLYDLLHMDNNFKCAYTINKHFKELIESPTLETKFPNLHVLILASYHEAVARQPLLEPAKRAWYEFTDILLPEVCVYRILTHLGNRDLRMIVDGLKA